MEKVIYAGLICSLIVFLIRDSLIFSPIRDNIIKRITPLIVKGGITGSVSFVINYWFKCVVCLSAVLLLPIILVNGYEFISSIVISTLSYRWTFAQNKI